MKHTPLISAFLLSATLLVTLNNYAEESQINARFVCAKLRDSDKQWTQLDHELDISRGRIELCELFSTGRRVNKCQRHEILYSYADDDVVYIVTDEDDRITMKRDDNFSYRGKEGAIRIEWPGWDGFLGCLRGGR